MNLKEWAKSRLKRVDFDVHFVASTTGQVRLAEILERPNPLFRWFAALHLERVRAGDWIRDDELATAREVVLDLYQFAGRAVPSYFPRRPLEDLYNPDLRVWLDLLRHHKVRINQNGGEATILFTEDLEHAEVREFLGALPQTVKYRQRGKTTVVENPKGFRLWLASGRQRRPWWKRWLGLR